ncbi:uncharacterized protein LOC142325339 [Lycorma delicatula]|uniref:uncharacterized protein LOC142325339 n=1 Tax=Lycorma delicatula TaxID=130591 RepID=UPI003F519572
MTCQSTICIDHICRVCAEEDCEQFIPIFEHPGLELSLLSKIESHLPIKVQISDSLPHQVCEPCICKLNICHELVQTAKAADLKLRHLLINSSNNVSANDKSSSTEDNSVQCNAIDVEHFQLHNDNLSENKTFQLSSVSDKTLEDVQFEISISDSIEVVKTIEGPSGQPIHHVTETSVVVSNDDVFGITSSEENVKLTNLIHDNQQFSLRSVYQPQLNDEHNAKNIVSVIEEHHVLPKSLLVSEDKQQTLVEEDERTKDDKVISKLSCPDCGKICKTINGLDVHMSTHSDDSPYLCDLCGKNFKHVNSLYGHKRTHLDESEKKRHQCAICSKAFRSKFHLSEHMNIHNGVKPYKCPDCGKTFHRSIQLRQHASTHLSEQDKLMCFDCGARFNRRNNLQQHIKKCHDENRTYKCRVCSEEFTTLNRLLSHRSSHKKAGDRQLPTSEHCYPCHICGKVLPKKKSLEVHLVSHSGENKCWCNICGKQLSSRASLRYHIRALHCTERSWHCQYCGKGYMSRELQLIHERTHTGVKPYKCSVCNKAFSGSNSLNQHMQKHSNARKFQCTYCLKRFLRKGTLNIHVRTHTGDKPYACDICGHRFIQKNDMLKHQKTHQIQTVVYNPPQNQSTDENIVHEHLHPCESCHNTFSSKHELNKHKVLNHGITIPVIFNGENSDVITDIEIITGDDENILTSIKCPNM